jgi:hypothetical protein
MSVCSVRQLRDLGEYDGLLAGCQVAAVEIQADDVAGPPTRPPRRRTLVAGGSDGAWASAAASFWLASAILAVYFLAAALRAAFSNAYVGVRSV